ncbi:MAG: Rrf2 family transcriptional regulator [bacterium]|nr:Rrf2 family transcriptional regulator [bacterium]
MRITHWGEYGAQCCIYIARASLEGRAIVGAAEIAEAQGIGIEYAQQILHRLRKAGVIGSVRGPNGGYKLNKSVDELTLMDVLHAVEGTSFEVICEKKPLNSTRCGTGSNCSLRPLWYELRDHVNEFLFRFSLRTLVEKQIEIEGNTGNIGIEGKTVQIGKARAYDKRDSISTDTKHLAGPA